MDEVVVVKQGEDRTYLVKSKEVCIEVVETLDHIQANLL